MGKSVNDTMNELVRQGAVWYGPKMVERIIEAVDEVANHSGARKFTATLGTIEWYALLDEIGSRPEPGLHDVDLHSAAGPVNCVHDKRCEGITVTSVREGTENASPRHDVIDWARATDQQLRAELARRGLADDCHAPFLTNLGNLLAKHGYPEGVDSLSWLDAQLSKNTMGAAKVAHAGTATGIPLPLSRSLLSAPAGLDPNAYRAVIDRLEHNSGIALLPEPRPEPLAFLDEDLLCDDAD